jgi:4-amino-4-deoxy-L-arabinose transferase-like glycosyltransferase
MIDVPQKAAQPQQPFMRFVSLLVVGQIGVYALRGGLGFEGEGLTPRVALNGVVILVLAGLLFALHQRRRWSPRTLIVLALLGVAILLVFTISAGALTAITALNSVSIVLWSTISLVLLMHRPRN